MLYMPASESARGCAAAKLKPSAADAATSAAADPATAATTVFFLFDQRTLVSSQQCTKM